MPIARTSSTPVSTTHLRPTDNARCRKGSGARADRPGGYRPIAGRLDDIESIFAVTDVMAVGAMRAQRVAGPVPGEDIAVAGFDDIDAAMDVDPALTTV